jgi:hypothetical protein
VTIVKAGGLGFLGSQASGEGYDPGLVWLAARSHKFGKAPIWAEMKKRLVHGDDLLYRFFEEGFRSRPEVFAFVPQLLITATAIWLPLDVYRTWPVLLPWVIRDPTCRGKRKTGLPDMWSAPDRHGYLRDDNSLIKSLTRSLVVQGPPGSHAHGSTMGTEFVASHVWRVVNADQLASRTPLLNSFVLNLVWLPSQVAKLSDREGGAVQHVLQAMAYEIYRRAPVNPARAAITERAWETLPRPEVDLEAIDIDSLNWFKTTDAFYRTRAGRLDSVIDALTALEEGKDLPDRVVTTRYAAGLPLVPLAARTELRQFLSEFRDTDAE